MSNEFFNASKEIANDFLQNIIFIDDKAYENINNTQGPNINHDFNALRVSKAFAKNNKICGIYRPADPEDLDTLSIIARKADIVILDWFININEPDAVEGEEETDEEEDDPRGLFTLKLISRIINDETKDDLKLIMIYTGDTDLVEICKRIYTKLIQNGITINTHENCRIVADSFIISIIHKSKDGSGEQLKHDATLATKIKTYEELPEVILHEFTNLTSGLLSNFALKAITEIRNNSSKLLSTFSKDIDPAYLSHLSLLPNQEEANELLVEILSDSIGAILRYKNINKHISHEIIQSWVKANIIEEDRAILDKNGESTKAKYALTHDAINQLLCSNDKNINNRFLNALTPIKFAKGAVERYVKNQNITLFSKQHKDKCEDIHTKFATLTHSKSCFIPTSIEPKPTLGSVVKSTIDRDYTYYVCIQQRCDSVRIEQERRFLFLPLEEVQNGKFHLITPTGIKLKLVNNSYSIRTIKFLGDNTDLIVKAINIGGKFFFNQVHTEDNEAFEWIFDLKDLVAQQIANDYASTLSRVGLDQYEWIRRS